MFELAEMLSISMAVSKGESTPIALGSLRASDLRSGIRPSSPDPLVFPKADY